MARRAGQPALLAANVAAEVGAPFVPCVLGEAAQLSLVEQRSYVAGFRVEARPQAWIADPVVSVLQHGCHVTVQPRTDGEHMALDVSLHAAELVEPMAHTTHEIAAGTKPVSVQVPVLFHQELGARPSLRPGEAVCVTWPRSRDLDQVVLLVLECEREATPRRAGVSDPRQLAGGVRAGQPGARDLVEPRRGGKPSSRWRATAGNVPFQCWNAGRLRRLTGRGARSPGS